MPNRPDSLMFSLQELAELEHKRQAEAKAAAEEQHAREEQAREAARQFAEQLERERQQAANEAAAAAERRRRDEEAERKARADAIVAAAVAESEAKLAALRAPCTEILPPAPEPRRPPWGLMVAAFLVCGAFGVFTALLLGARSDVVAARQETVREVARADKAESQLHLERAAGAKLGVRIEELEAQLKERREAAPAPGCQKRAKPVLPVPTVRKNGKCDPNTADPLNGCLP